MPADDPLQFEPRVTDDTNFGRGSTDMKGGLVSMIYAMKALSEAGDDLDGKVALRIVPDEETGGALGSRALTELGQLVGDDAVAMFTAEPTGGTVWHASRGAITCRITVKGRPSHVGLQYRGVNAFEKMLVVAAALIRLKDEVERRVTSYPLEPEQARHSILMIGGETSGGRNFNVVPESFTFTVDRRSNPRRRLRHRATTPARSRSLRRQECRCRGGRGRIPRGSTRGCLRDPSCSRYARESY